MFSFKQKGDFSKTEKFLKKAIGKDYMSVLEKYAQQGVRALSAATPVESGLTAASWSYEIVREGSGLSIFWNNSNVNKGVKIALILQYGHGTRNGGYVVGRDYINPAIRSVFDNMAIEVWNEITK